MEGRTAAASPLQEDDLRALRAYPEIKGVPAAEPGDVGDTFGAKRQRSGEMAAQDLHETALAIVAEGETVTEGLDGLRDRLEEYRGLGARFTKWRAVISIGKDIPSEYCIWVNAHALARFAALSQEAGLVPIVEPEVLMDGDHTIERSFEVTSHTLHAVFTELRDQRVQPEGILLKPNIVLPGYESSQQVSDEEIAEATLRCFRRHVPAAVPGIVFLSGGQSEEEATRRLNAINAIGPHPWKVSFSYGRALQASALKAWGGHEENVEAAQRAYYHRARMNSLAQTGTYAPELEKEAVAV